MACAGPQFHAAWCDELAKWKQAENAWNMLQFALRLGQTPAGADHHDAAAHAAAEAVAFGSGHGDEPFHHLRQLSQPAEIIS